jgi:hypothetical protein
MGNESKYTQSRQFQAETGRIGDELQHIDSQDDLADAARKLASIRERGLQLKVARGVSFEGTAFGDTDTTGMALARKQEAFGRFDGVVRAVERKVDLALAKQSLGTCLNNYFPPFSNEDTHEIVIKENGTGLTDGATAAHERSLIRPRVNAQQLYSKMLAICKNYGNVIKNTKARCLRHESGAFLWLLANGNMKLVDLFLIEPVLKNAAYGPEIEYYAHGLASEYNAELVKFVFGDIYAGVHNTLCMFAAGASREDKGFRLMGIKGVEARQQQMIKRTEFVRENTAGNMSFVNFSSRYLEATAELEKTVSEFDGLVALGKSWALPWRYSSDLAASTMFVPGDMPQDHTIRLKLVGELATKSETTDTICKMLEGITTSHTFKGSSDTRAILDLQSKAQAVPESQEQPEIVIDLMEGDSPQWAKDSSHWADEPQEHTDTGVDLVLQYLMANSPSYAVGELPFFINE